MKKTFRHSKMGFTNTSVKHNITVEANKSMMILILTLNNLIFNKKRFSQKNSNG